MKRDWVSLGVIIVLLLLALSVLIGDGPIRIVFTLVTGWVGYLTRVGSKVTVNWPGVALGAVCALLIVLIGHGFGRWMWRQTGHSTPWRLRWTGAAVAVLVLMFAAGTAAVGIAHQTAWLIRGPAPLFGIDGRPLRVRCAINLRQIHSAIMQYAREHGGRYPERLEELVETDLINAELLICPASNDEKAIGATTQEVIARLAREEHLSYVYIPGALSGPNGAGGARRVVLYEPLDHHEDGITVCYTDGTTEFLAAEEAERFLATRPPASRPAE
jgi:hypothetical protein